MKMLPINTTILAAAVLSMSAYTGLASAHCFNQTLSAASYSADLYRVQCYTAPVGTSGSNINAPAYKLTAQAYLNTGNPVRVQIGREGFRPSPIAQDATTGNTLLLEPDPNACLTGSGGIGVPSASVSLLPPDTATQPGTTAVDGNGDYNILVNKNGGTFTNYGLIFHCQNISGVHTGTREVHPGSAAPELAGNSSISPDIDLIIDN